MPHCASCWTEFVPGVSACSDCGGPLAAGPLPETRPVEETPEAPPAYPHLDAIDTALGEYPGSQAEFIARVLSLEGIHSRLECEGLKRYRGPKAQATGPIAETLPVEIFVAADDLERAQEIIASSEGDDLIGEQWSEGGEPIEVEVAEVEDPEDERIEPETVVLAATSSQPEVIEAERSNIPIFLILGAAIAVVAFILR